VAGVGIGEVHVLVNERTSINLPPTVDAGPDRTIEYADTTGEECGTLVTAVASDPDAHFLSYEWRDAAGTLVSEEPQVPICSQVPGSRVFSVTVRDGRGGEGHDMVTVTRVLTKEIVLWAADFEDIQGRWTLVPDSTAAGGVRAYDPISRRRR
jgi:hypothetical protein